MFIPRNITYFRAKFFCLNGSMNKQEAKINYLFVPSSKRQIVQVL